MPMAKGKKPAQAAGGKKEEKSDAKKPPQEKKAESAPAKAKKEGAPKQGSAPAKKKDAPKQSAGAAAGGDKSKDKGKKRKLNETTQGKPKPAAGSDSKKKKVEKKVQGKAKAGAKAGTVGGKRPKSVKKPIKKQMSKPKPIVKRDTRPKRPRAGKQEIVVYEGRRYFLLPSGQLKAVLDVKLEENDKIAKVEGAFIRKSDVKAFEEFKASTKGSTPGAVKRKLRLKLSNLRRALIKDLVKEAKVAKKQQAAATPKDTGREVKIMTLVNGTFIRKKALPRIKNFEHNKIIQLKKARTEKGGKELTEQEKKTLASYMRKLVHIENYKLRQALLSKRPSAALKQKKLTANQQKARAARAGLKKKPAPAKAKEAKATKAVKTAKAAPSKASKPDTKKKTPAKKEKAAK